MTTDKAAVIITSSKSNMNRNSDSNRTVAAKAALTNTDSSNNSNDYRDSSNTAVAGATTLIRPTQQQQPLCQCCRSISDNTAAEAAAKAKAPRQLQPYNRSSCCTLFIFYKNIIFFQRLHVLIFEVKLSLHCS